MLSGHQRPGARELVANLPFRPGRLAFGKVLLLSHGYRCELGRTPIREGQPDPATLGAAVNAVQGLRRNDPPEILSPRGHPDPDRSRRLRLRGRYIRLPPRHCPDAARATDARDRIWMLAAAGPDVAAITSTVSAFSAYSPDCAKSKPNHKARNTRASASPNARSSLQACIRSKSLT